MKKWAIAAIVYLLTVIGGYSIYASLAVDGKREETKQNHHESTEKKETDSHEAESHEHGEERSDHDSTAIADSEVTTSLEVHGQELVIAIKDLSGNAVTDLEVNHEKIMHLIVVDTHLNQYVHLHPEQIEPGLFKVQHGLLNGSYKAFIDIKPKQLGYHVQPVSFSIGEKGKEHAHNSLKVDQKLTKTVDERTVTLELSSLQAEESVELKFLVNGPLEPYLGAVGHVVILDEKAEQYVHVHPANDTEPIFETQFDQPGIYKIWAEFKQEGEVRIYPFTVEITQ